MMTTERFLTTRDAAMRLGISPRRVRALIHSGRLPAERVGRDWLIRENALEQVRHRVAGYPRGRKRRARA